MPLDIRPLDPRLGFGVSVSGMTRQLAEKPAVRDEINALFESAGLIIFKEVEPTNGMQLALSNIFGPLKEHPVPSISRVDRDAMPGVIELRTGVDRGGIVEFGGKQISHWLPWHFDHCYNDELNRAGILRSAKVSPTGGITGFLDGIALYRLFPKDLLAKIEDAEILYTLNSHYETQKFGNPPDLKIIRSKPLSAEFDAQAKAMPRAIHPAVWTRRTGEKVLHVSPYMADGIVGQETPEGEALFSEVAEAIARTAPECSYHHKWQADEMVIWDNWRMLHAVSGHDPSHERIMYRTTIKGDYGLGRFENGAQGGAILRDTMV